MADTPQTNSGKKEQKHPQWSSDRLLVDRLLQEDPNDYALAELARLRIRYQDFPGAYDIQQDLDKVLKKWQLTEEALFAKTREIHAQGPIYRFHSGKREDWT